MCGFGYACYTKLTTPSAFLSKFIQSIFIATADKMQMKSKHIHSLPSAYSLANPLTPTVAIWVQLYTVSQ